MEANSPKEDGTLVARPAANGACRLPESLAVPDIRGRPDVRADQGQAVLLQGTCRGASGPAHHCPCHVAPGQPHAWAWQMRKATHHR